MCQITVANLNSEVLNKELATIMMSLGSTVHGDGWGIMGNDGVLTKCQYPAYLTSNLGFFVKSKKTSSKPLVGHIRRASIGVPVSEKNAHPFSGKDIQFVHNGSLVPKEPKNFVLKELGRVSRYNAATKLTEIKTEDVNISDSLIFFKEFLKEVPDRVTMTDNLFVEAVISTVDKFYGKFAFVFYFNKTKSTYVVRGKTAKLYITYLMSSREKDAEVLGYVINTSDDILRMGTSLLSSLNQLKLRGELYFSNIVEVKAETIFKVEKTRFLEIGEVKETAEPTTFAAWNGTRTISYTAKTEEEKLLEKSTKEIHEFMETYMITLKEIQYMFLALYGISLLEVTAKEAEHFYTKVIPAMKKLLEKKEGKKIRKSLKKASAGFIGTFVYLRDKDRYLFPWMLNTQTDIHRLISEMEKEGLR